MMQSTTNTAKEPVSPHDVLLTVEDLLRPEWLNLPSRNWIYQRVHSGTLPFDYLKVGTYLRFPASSVRSYIERQTRKVGAA